ncbi:hypothetical protein ACFL6G_09205 [candidate division KSB1 bacterium]
MENKDKINTAAAGSEGIRDGNMIPVFAWGFLIFLFIMAVLIAGGIFFRSPAESILYESIEKPVPENLRILREREEKALNTYKLLDAEKGIYQIPIDRAIELTVEESKDKQ